jgi:hypothetical protein
MLKKEYAIPLLPFWAFVAYSRVNFTFIRGRMALWSIEKCLLVPKFCVVINNTQILFLKYTGWHKSLLACMVPLVSDFCAVCPPTNLYLYACLAFDMEIKGKAIPLQAWKNPEGSKRLR